MTRAVSASASALGEPAGTYTAPSPSASRCTAVSEVTIAQPAAAPWRTLLGTTRCAFGPVPKIPRQTWWPATASGQRVGVDPVDPGDAVVVAHERAGLVEVLAGADHGDGDGPVSREGGQRPAHVGRALQGRVEAEEDDAHRLVGARVGCGGGGEPGGRRGHRHHDDLLRVRREAGALGGGVHHHHVGGAERGPVDEVEHAGGQRRLAETAVADRVAQRHHVVQHDRAAAGTAAGPGARRSARGRAPPRRQGAGPSPGARAAPSTTPAGPGGSARATVAGPCGRGPRSPARGGRRGSSPRGRGARCPRGGPAPADACPRRRCRRTRLARRGDGRRSTAGERHRGRVWVAPRPGHG